MLFIKVIIMIINPYFILLIYGISIYINHIISYKNLVIIIIIYYLILLYLYQFSILLNLLVFIMVYFYIFYVFKYF